MNEREFGERLIDLVTAAGDDDRDFEAVGCQTFDEAGLLTRNKGIVIQFANGDEFQVTIRQSEFGDLDTNED